MRTQKLLNYFLQGLFICGPIAITIYALIAVFKMIDGIIPVSDVFTQLLGFRIYGVGFIIIVSIVIGIGYFSSNFFLNKLISLMESLINRSQVVKQIYSSIKDLIGAFAGEEKRFNQPVLIMIDKANNIERMGFITQTDLEDIGAAGKVAVYCPMSYSFAGEVLIVPRESVTLVTGISATEAMKFIVSGGVTKLDD